MIVLDTNIISEIMRPRPSANVTNWLNAQAAHQLYVTAVTIAEILYGLQILPEGKRRRRLEHSFETFIANAFDQRVLVFDEAAGRKYAELMAYRKKIGQPMSLPDGQIAAIASVHGFSVATRNIDDFESCGLQLINPFEQLV
jgi:hypothetical protein